MLVSSETEYTTRSGHRAVIDTRSSDHVVGKVYVSKEDYDLYRYERERGRDDGGYYVVAIWELDGSNVHDFRYTLDLCHEGYFKTFGLLEENTWYLSSGGLHVYIYSVDYDLPIPYSAAIFSPTQAYLFSTGYRTAETPRSAQNGLSLEDLIITSKLDRTLL